MTILDTYVEPVLVSSIFLCAIVILVSLLIGITCYIIIDDNIAAGIMAGCIFFAVTMIGLFLSGYFKPHTRYEVTIDDSVPFVEIYEKYDVIDHHGDIYVLEEKDDNN